MAEFSVRIGQGGDHGLLADRTIVADSLPEAFAAAKRIGEECRELWPVRVDVLPVGSYRGESCYLYSQDNRPCSVTSESAGPVEVDLDTFCAARSAGIEERG